MTPRAVIVDLRNAKDERKEDRSAWPLVKIRTRSIIARARAEARLVIVINRGIINRRSSLIARSNLGELNEA